MTAQADGETALIMAIESQNADVDIIKTLLNKCADPNIQRTTDGVSALLIATNRKYIHIVNELLKHCANPKLIGKTTKGQTVNAFDFVCSSNNQNDLEICNLLNKAPVRCSACAS